MKIFIPMAGRGTRLRPFTLSKPKPLLEIIDKPIVEHLIDQITSTLSSEIEEIVYILGEEAYFDSTVVDSLTLISKKYNAKTKVYRQLDKLGTGHAIMCAEESLSGPAIIAYADTMIQGKIEIDLKSDGMIWVKKVEDPSSYGVVNVDEEYNIKELIEKPKDFVSDLAVVGIYYFKESSFLRDELKIHLKEKLEPGREYLLNYGIEKMIEKNKIFKSQEIETWMDCGTPQLLLESAKIIMKSKEKYSNENNFSREGKVIINDPVFIGKNVSLKNSTLGPNVSIGNNCVITDSKIQSSIVYNDSNISNANINNSILGSNCNYDGSNKEIFLGDYSQINNNEK
ncbi:MAG: sugar phosphate nucleotidyltransferase [Flavobacteriaceae bacterium]|nr:sugar phosphate nucleotidyltransferase [Flavobacteriaceae bacterium]